MRAISLVENQFEPDQSISALSLLQTLQLCDKHRCKSSRRL